MKVLFLFCICNFAITFALNTKADCSSLKDGTTLPKYGDCENFYVCDRGVAIEKNCGLGLHYSPVLKYCVDKDLAGCDSGTNPSCTGMSDGVTLPMPEDCKKFYVCIGNKARPQNCLFGQHYNKILKYCEQKNNADCDTSGGGGGDPSDPTIPQIACKNQELGRLVPYPNICTKFIVCIGLGVVKDCPAPLHFNEFLQVCDQPQTANCPWK